LAKKEGNESQDQPAPAESVDKLRKMLAEEQKRNEDLLTRLRYAQADLENYRKRVDKEMKEAGESLARSLASKLLTVQDELDLAAKHAESAKDAKELEEGIAMVKKNLESALESVGVERIESVGRTFDPSIHEAVEKVQGEAAGDDVVIEELRSGFTFRGQLLRPSMVKVELATRTAKEAKVSE